MGFDNGILRLLLVISVLFVLTQAHDQSEYKPLNLLHVLRYARTREVNSPRSMPANVIEETRFITKEDEDGRTPLSFAIISWLKSMMPFSRRTQPERASYRSQDVRTDDQLSSSATAYTSASPYAKGRFTVSNGIVKFIPNIVHSTTPRAAGYFLKKSKPEIKGTSQKTSISHDGFRAAARLSDHNPADVKESYHKDGLFSIRNGVIQFHRRVSEPLSAAGGTSYVEESRHSGSSPPSPAPRWNYRSEVTADTRAFSETNKANVSSYRIPSLRIDDETIFVPTETSTDGQILFNRMNVRDYLQQERLNKSQFPAHYNEEPLASNILLSQMEAFFPGFSEIVKDRSQIMIQNVFLAPLVDKIKSTNPVQLKSSSDRELPIIRTTDAAVYVPSDSFSNGTITYERHNIREIEDGEVERRSVSITHIEAYYPGFTKLVERKPPQIVIHTSILTIRKSSESIKNLSKNFVLSSRGLPVVRIDDETVLIPSAPFANGTLVYNKHSINKKLDVFEDRGSVVDVDQMQVYYPGFEKVVKNRPDRIVINNYFSVPKPETDRRVSSVTTNNDRVKLKDKSQITMPVTASSVGISEEQVRPPVTIRNTPQFFTLKPKPNLYQYWRRPTTTSQPPVSTTTTKTTTNLQPLSENSNSNVQPNQINDVITQLLDGPRLPQVVTAQASNISSWTAESNRTVSTTQSSRIPESSNIQMGYDTVDSIDLDSNGPLKVPTGTSESTGSPAEMETYTEPNGMLMTLSAAPEKYLHNNVAVTTSFPVSKKVPWISRRPSLTARPKPSILISSSSSSSSNLASLVLAHTAALLAAKPSSFPAKQPPIQAENNDNIANQFSESHALDSIVLQLQQPNKKPIGPATSLTSSSLRDEPTNPSLNNQIYSMASSLMTGQGGSDVALNLFRDALSEVSESTVENPVTQALVTTTVDQIANVEPSSLQPDKEFITDPTYLDEFTTEFSSFQNRPQEDSMDSMDIADTATELSSLTNLLTGNDQKTVEVTEEMPNTSVFGNQPEIFEEEGDPLSSDMNLPQWQPTDAVQLFDGEFTEPSATPSVATSDVPVPSFTYSESSSDLTDTSDVADKFSSQTVDELATLNSPFSSSAISLSSNSPPTSGSVSSVETNRMKCGEESTAIKSFFSNPSYPSPDFNRGRCTFHVKIISTQVCQLRVQFNNSKMLLPREGFCVDQFMQVSGSVVIPGVEKFCGKNSDQHFFLDLAEPVLTDPQPRYVDFTVVTRVEGYPYQYGLTVQQIECADTTVNELRAPRGCFQYFSEMSGVIKSFNYEGGDYFNNVNYRICLRSADQSCALALVAPNGHFGLHKANSRKVPRNRSGVGSRACVRDYLFIPAGSRNGKVEAITEERYCGAKLSPINGDRQPRVIIAPKHSKVYSLIFRTGTPRKFLAHNRGPGFRLSFAHIRHCVRNGTSVNHLRFSDINENMKHQLRLILDAETETFPGSDDEEEEMDREFSEDYYDSDEDEPMARVGSLAAI